MNFLEPQPSAFDLRFRLLGIPVRVHPTFWVFGAIFGWSFFQMYGFPYLLIWIACAFVSVLVHEMGHAATAGMFGRPSHIVLYGMGGLAIGQYQLARPWQRVAIYLAGPIAGFLLLAFIEGAHYVFRQHLLHRIDPEGATFLHRGYGGTGAGLGTIFGMLVFMNLFWNLMNLIPVFPLDGGQVLREVAVGASPRRGMQIALGASFVLAGAVAAYSLLVRSRPDLWYPNLDPTFTAILFGILAMQNYMMLQDERQRDRWQEPQW